MKLPFLFRSNLLNYGFYTFFCGMLLLSACGPGARDRWNNETNQKSSAVAAGNNAQSGEDSTATPQNGFISSMAAKYQDSVRKFIKTADIKFRVNNVYLSTYTIEDIIRKQGGFVTSTSLKSDIDNTETQEMTDDSSLESIHYTVSNSMILRVPCVKLDTTLRLIAKLINYLDYRNIDAEDVQFDILYNQYSIHRAYGYENRLSGHIKNEGKKLNETTNAEETLTNLQKEADNAHIEILKMEDKIKFSTINLIVYQRETTKHQLVVNEKNIKRYEPGFGFKVWSAIKSGWELLKELVILLLNIWFLFVIAGVVYILLRVINKKKGE